MYSRNKSPEEMELPDLDLPIVEIQPTKNNPLISIPDQVLAKQVAWSSELVIGNPPLDFLHRKLMQKIRRLCEAFCHWEKAPTEARYLEMVQRASRFTGALMSHCEVENFIMLNDKALSKANKQFHLKSHMEEINFFKELGLDLQSRKIILTSNYLSLIARRFRRHILECDSPAFGGSKFDSRLQILFAGQRN